MLRAFCGSSWSEKDLSSCLSRSGYSVELAAERLMTGQYQPTKQGLSSMSSVANSRASSNNASSANAARKHHSTKPQVDIVTPNSIDMKKKRPSPSSSTSDCPARQVTPKTPKLVHPNQSFHPKSMAESSWLLCNRWISDGTCTQRNGSVDYQEKLALEHNRDGPPMIRFRGRRITGQIPKFLGQILTPILRASDERIASNGNCKPILHLEAEALMEDGGLPMGADVAFSLRYVHIVGHNTVSSSLLALPLSNGYHSC